jgi:hypothetical protein
MDFLSTTEFCASEVSYHTVQTVRGEGKARNKVSNSVRVSDDVRIRNIGGLRDIFEYHLLQSRTVSIGTYVAHAKVSREQSGHGDHGDDDLDSRRGAHHVDLFVE